MSELRKFVEDIVAHDHAKYCRKDGSACVATCVNGRAALAEKPAERPDTRTYPCGTVANGPAIPEVCPVHGVECEVRMRWEKTCRERAERPQLSVEQVRERVTLLRRYEFKGNGPFVKLEDVDRAIRALADSPVSGATKEKRDE